MNRYALAIMLRNLVDNACRYTPVNGSVEIICDQNTGGTTVTISNSGDGIPADQHKAVFDRFVRLNPSDTQGSGLGLSIANRIAESLGATIELGEREGGGISIRVLWHSLHFT